MRNSHLGIFPSILKVLRNEVFVSPELANTINLFCEEGLILKSGHIKREAAEDITVFSVLHSFDLMLQKKFEENRINRIYGDSMYTQHEKEIMKRRGFDVDKREAYLNELRFGTPAMQRRREEMEWDDTKQCWVRVKRWDEDKQCERGFFLSFSSPT